jgi:hypothetical protein
MALFNRFRPGRAKLPSAQGDDQELDEIARMRAGPRSPGLGQTGSAPINQRNTAEDAAATRARVDAAADQRAGEVRDRKNPDKDGDGIDDGLDDIARMRADQGRERQAREEELRVSKAKALQQADSRSGLGGFGLSGASAALKSDLSRTHDRNATLALGDLGRKQRDEEWQMKQREAAVLALEEESGSDLNGDGSVGPKGNAVEDFKADRDQRQNDLNAELAKANTLDSSVFDADTGAGTLNEPYEVTQDQIDAWKSQYDLRLTRVEGTGDFVVLKDQYGRYYYVKGT